MSIRLKAYSDLTRRGKLKRTNNLARTALNAYGFTDATLKLIIDAGNTTYRIGARGKPSFNTDLFVENCYSLRLHQPGYQNEGAVDSELKWLLELSDEGFPVPQPIPTTDGELSTYVSTNGAPERRCSLLRWVKGRLPLKPIKPWHLKAIGRLIARLQNHSSRWSPPSGFVRRHYDKNGLWGNDTGTGYTADQVIPLIPKKYAEAFHEVKSQVERLMEVWGKGPDVYGLIHADLGTDANVVFHRGEARAIDFDDGGYGYWIYDLAIPLIDHDGNDALPSFREALLEGFEEYRSLPEEQLEKLEWFMAAFRALEIFWGTAATLHNPESTYWIERRENAWKYLEKALNSVSI